MASRGSPTFRLLTPDDLEALPDLTWLVDGIIPTNAFCVLYGEPGSGKTFVALSLALSIAAGKNWCGRTTRSGAVLYVAAEGLYGLKLRASAYQKRHGIKPERIRYSGEVFDLLSPVEIKALLLALKETDFRPDLIILDTLARLMSGADENSVKEMSSAIAGIDELRRETSASVIVVHHSRKSGGVERGSSALRGAADVMIECSSSDIALVGLKCDKMKDAAPFKLGQLGLECIPLGPSLSSLAVTGWKEALEAGADRATAKRALEILETQFGTTGAKHADWLAAYRQETKQSKSTFERAISKLKEGGAARLENGKYYPNRPDGGVSVSPVSP
jgi:hypothetical protein